MSCLSSLLKIALENDADLAATAQATLAEMPGEKVDGQVALLPKAEGKCIRCCCESSWASAHRRCTGAARAITPTAIVRQARLWTLGARNRALQGCPC
ncbi:MAG: hypothetical protein R3C19_09830 [Planctomycetaceae bacterium]